MVEDWFFGIALLKCHNLDYTGKERSQYYRQDSLVEEVRIRLESLDKSVTWLVERHSYAVKTEMHESLISTMLK